MATTKTFSVAGISKLNGEYKVRFANDIMRIKVLAKHGHEDIRLADLEGEFTKLDAARAILALEDFEDATAQATITEYIEDNTPKVAAPKAKAPAKVAAPKAVKTPQVPALKGMTPLGVKAAKVAEDEDAPF
jgi:hypothetical protein